MLISDILLPLLLLSTSTAALPRAGDYYDAAAGVTVSKPNKLVKPSKPNKLNSYKYFHESYFDPHYDGRFAKARLPYNQKILALRNLLQAYLATFADLQIETWLVHGSLMGWWWGKKILPWDSDIDVQVSEEGLYQLAGKYNMSIFHYETPRFKPGGVDYMLEVNPHYNIREQRDTQNVIDARWIDTTSGLFIDITAVRKMPGTPSGVLTCKDGHSYQTTSLYPLRETTIEGVPAKIPNQFRMLLSSEYGARSLTATEFEEHVFHDDIMEWLPKPFGKYDLPANRQKTPVSVSPPIINGRAVVPDP